MSTPHPPAVPPVPPGSPQPEQLLNQPVSAGDLTAELKQSKRSFGKLTIGLAAAVLLAAAFFGGIATHAALAEDNQQPTAQGGRQLPGAGQRPGGTGQGPLRGGTVGTIDRIEGADVYVKTPDGRTVKVSTTDSTEVRISQEGALSDLNSGDTIAVQGDTAPDGTVSAQTITEGALRPTG